MDPYHYEFIMEHYGCLSFFNGYFFLMCFIFLKGCCQICFYHHAKWIRCIMISRKKSSFFQAQGAVWAVLIISLQIHYAAKSVLHYAKCKLLFPSCIMIKKKIYIFPSTGCCQSCCSHNAKWAKKNPYFPIRGAVWAVVLIMHYDLRKKN